ncbi:MAG: sigma-70 family RNA polymerase sigma factor, partial [Phototrophicaceae bacterium]
MTEESQSVDQTQEKLPPDSQLYPLLMSNDNVAWSAFEQYYASRINDYFKNRNVQAVRDREDLTQSVFVQFFITLRDGRFNPAKGNLAQWLYGIAQKLLERHKKQYAQDYSKHSEFKDDFVHEEDDDIELSETFSEQVQDALNQLSPKIREVVLMRIQRNDSITWKDIAAELGISESAAKTRYWR